jgi:hypothetical protein
MLKAEKIKEELVQMSIPGLMPRESSRCLIQRDVTQSSSRFYQPLVKQEEDSVKVSERNQSYILNIRSRPFQQIES